MTLERYIRKTNTTPALFGESIGLPPQTIYRYLKGRIPAPHVMVAVCEATGFAVMPNDFYGIRK